MKKITQTIRVAVVQNPTTKRDVMLRVTAAGRIAGRRYVKAYKVAKVATSIYGAADVKYDAAALEDLARLRDAGLDRLPICIAKTQLSLSDDERVLGAPTGWTLQVRGIRPSAGAGFLVVLAGDIMRMPGLGEEPAALAMDIDDDGRIRGLF